MIAKNRRILFICPDIKRAVGGIKQLYRQVDLLNKNGFKAFIVHSKYGFRSTWFENSTPVLYNADLHIDLVDKNHSNKKLFFILKRVGKDILKFRKTITRVKNKKWQTIFNDSDVIVVPEIYGPGVERVLPNNDKVVYNQNCYYTFNAYKLKGNCSLYSNSKIKGIMVASEDAGNYLHYAFPGLNLFRIHYGINKNIFNFSANKKKQIAFMARKVKEDIIQVINILKIRDALKGWDLIEIANLNEQEVSKILKESALFLSFSHREGFGMPPAEAMACGCIVIGYTGNGGDEYFKESFSYPIAERNIQGFAKTIEQVILEYENDNRALLEKGRMASEFILKEYSLEVEEEDIVNVWSNILKTNE